MPGKEIQYFRCDYAGECSGNEHCPHYKKHPLIYDAPVGDENTSAPGPCSMPGYCGESGGKNGIVRCIPIKEEE